MKKNSVRLADGNKYLINDCQIYRNILTIVFDESVDFMSFVENASFLFSSVEFLNSFDYSCGSYEGFVTIYRQENNTFKLSNDGSVYIEPEVEDSKPIIEELTLEEIKELKIQDFSNMCKNMIEYGVHVDIDTQREHFAYKQSEDQANIDDLFNMVMNTGLAVPYHNTNGSCKLYTPEQIMKIYIAVKTNKTHHLTYFNQMRSYINSLETKEEVENLTYGTELTGEYLNVYNIAMTQAQLIINATIAKAKESNIIVDESEQYVDTNDVVETYSND